MVGGFSVERADEPRRFSNFRFRKQLRDKHNDYVDRSACGLPPARPGRRSRDRWPSVRKGSR